MDKDKYYCTELNAHTFTQLKNVCIKVCVINTSQLVFILCCKGKLVM